MNIPLMLVTALSPIIGYDKASAIAHRALDQNTTLREAALSGGFISAEEFDKVMDPKKMVGNPRHDLGMLDLDSR
jgi:fumarate hydratase class II